MSKERVNLERRDEAVVLTAGIDGIRDKIGAIHPGYTLVVVLYPLLPAAGLAYLAAFGDVARPGTTWGLSIASLVLGVAYIWWILTRGSHSQYEFIFEPKRVLVRYGEKTLERELSIEPGDEIELLTKQHSTSLAVGSELVGIIVPLDREDAISLVEAIRSHVGPPETAVSDVTDEAVDLETGEWVADRSCVEIESSRIRVIPRPLRESGYGLYVLGTGVIGTIFFGAMIVLSVYTGQALVGVFFGGFLVLCLAMLLWYAGRKVVWEAEVSTARITKTVSWFFGREHKKSIDIGPDDRLRLKTTWSDPDAFTLVLEDGDASEKLMADANQAVVRLVATNLAAAFDLDFVDEHADDGV